MDSAHITRCCVFACCAAHPRSDQSQVQVVCPDLPHGDVRLWLCAVADGCHLFATAGDPSCDHQPMVCGFSSSSSLMFGVCCTLCAPSVTSSASFTAFYRTATSIVSPGVVVSLCRTLASIDCATSRCLTAVCHFPNNLSPLTLAHKYILSSDRDLKLHDRYVGYMTVTSVTVRYSQGSPQS